MAAAWVQGGGANGASVTSYTYTLPSAVTAGDSLFSSVQFQNAPTTYTPAVSDNRNGTWTTDNPRQTSGSNNAIVGPLHVFNAAAGSTTITIASGGTTMWSSISVEEVSGLGTGPTVNVHGTTSGTSTTPTTSSFTPAAGDFVFVGYSINTTETTVTPNSGWLDGSDATHHQLGGIVAGNYNGDEAAEYQLSASGAAITGGWTVNASSDWAIDWASYTPGTAATPARPFIPHRMPLGA